MEAETGAILGNKVIRGSHMNITCTIESSKCKRLTWFWERDYHLITQNYTEYGKHNGTKCVRKLVLENVTSGGLYQCKVMGWAKLKIHMTAIATNLIVIGVGKLNNTCVR